MINKQNLWFITLFSLILILGVYYISMPKDSLEVFKGNDNAVMNPVDITESDVIVALKVEAEEDMIKQMENAREILLNESSTAIAKNEAYETLKQLNSQKGKILEIEKKIKEKFELESCVKIDGNKINITLSCENKGSELANNIIREVQSLYDAQMYITVKFQK